LTGRGGSAKLLAPQQEEEVPVVADKLASERFKAVIFYGVLLLFLYLVFRIFQPFLVPMAWAGVLVVVFYPWHQWLVQRWGRTRAAILSTLGVTLILVIPMIFITTAFVREGLAAIRSIEEIGTERRAEILESALRLWKNIEGRLPVELDLDLVALAKQAAQLVGGFVAARAGAVARNVALFVFDFVVFLLSLYYLFRDSTVLAASLRRLAPFEEPLRGEMLTQARDLISASVTSSLIVGAVQGTIGGLAFAFLDIPGPVLWGVVMGLFSLLPVVGAWIVWAPVAIGLLLSGEIARGLVLVGVGAGLVGMVDNLLRPYLVSGRSRLSGLVIFVSLLGGVSVFGMLGMVLGPIVVATVFAIVDVYTREPGPEAVSETPSTPEPPPPAAAKEPESSKRLQPG
jgi:predicted PurR-regulated permease PerM